ncbi:hypothetical protein [Rhizobium sp. Root1220]|uniref:hypothetical protein n=1 Tax=Rhizobium sp. Root1220 TaxID=1736432 RepID=UPI0006FD36E7|nr:hypothetical protein [Rhizobium sp. Root1220]KQV83176.1 hypothetical protein ASC90_21470 [Rhizobium sp. Root1220]
MLHNGPYALIDDDLPLAAGHHTAEGPREVAFRAAAENGFRRTQAVMEFTGHGPRTKLSSLTSPDFISDISRFRRVLGVSAEAVDNYRDNARPLYGSRDWVTFHGCNVRRAYISPYRRVSPRRLRQESVLNSMWSLRPLTFDVGTRERLLDQCPTCQLKLGWGWAEDVALCDVCASMGRKCNLSDYCQEVLEFSDEEAVNFITDQVDPAFAERRSTYDLPAIFASTSRGQLFQFAIKIAAACNGDDPAKGITPAALENAGRSILSWPAGFERLLEGTPANITTSEQAGPAAFRPLNRLRSDPTLDANLRRLVGDMVCEARRKEVFSLRFNLHIPVGTVSARATRSELIKLETNLRKAVDQAAHRITSAPDDVQTLAIIIRDNKRHRQLADQLGVPTFELLQLYESGVLPSMELDLGQLTYLSLVGDAWEHVGALWKVRRSQEHGLPIVRAASLLSGRSDLPWPEIVHAICDRRLAVWRGPKAGPGIFGELRTRDYDGLERVLATRLQSRFQCVGTTHDEAARTMGIGRKIITDAIRQRVIPEIPTVAAINRIRADWMFSFEIKDLLKINGAAITVQFRALHRSKAERVLAESFSIWRRSDVYLFLAKLMPLPRLPKLAGCA